MIKVNNLDNIVYHLASADVIVTKNSLSLSGFEKNVYEYFNYDNIKEIIIL
jgi:hypothetical protein